MAGMFGLSVNPDIYTESFGEDLVKGLAFNQHRDERRCGLAIGNENEIVTHHGDGLILGNFGANARKLSGVCGIGHSGEFREPFSFLCTLGPMSMCFSGDIQNQHQLMVRLSGRVFATRDAIEIIANLISQTVVNDFVTCKKDESQVIGKSIGELHDTVTGDFALLIMTPEGIYVTLSPNNHKRLVLGQKQGAVAVSSESTALVARNFQIIREVRPSEILAMKNGEIIPIAQGGGGDFCVQQWIDRAFSSSIIGGMPVSLVRKRLGCALARRDIKAGFVPDIVTYPPNSARCHALGYYGEYISAINRGRIDNVPHFDEVLFKYPYLGKSTDDNGVETNIDRGRLLPCSEDMTGKVVVLCKASLTTGRQTKEDIIPKLRQIGVKEIHLRISCPKILGSCRWRARKNLDILLTERFARDQQIADYLGVDSIVFNKPKDLSRVISKLPICHACCSPL